MYASRSRIEHDRIRSHLNGLWSTDILYRNFFCCISFDSIPKRLLGNFVPGGREPSSEGKILRAHGGCLGIGSRRRARQAAISPGEAQTAFDPGIPEWGNPARVVPGYLRPNKIGRQGATGGTETSKYPEEEKSTEIARVAASESAPSPNPRTRYSPKALRRGGRGTAPPGASEPGAR